MFVRSSPSRHLFIFLACSFRRCSTPTAPVFLVNDTVRMETSNFLPMRLRPRLVSMGGSALKLSSELGYVVGAWRTYEDR